MRTGRRAVTEIFDNPILIGTITLLVVALAVFLSYIAENGLPFVPTYDINVQVANAGELVKNADVRIVGARVGQVLTIQPEPAARFTLPHYVAARTRSTGSRGSAGRSRCSSTSNRSARRRESAPPEPPIGEARGRSIGGAPSTRTRTCATSRCT